MTPSYEDALRALAREFAATVPARLAALHDAVARARAAGGATGPSAPRDAGVAALGEAVGHAHKLHGVAGSVGFPALGVAAGDVEEALRALATCPGDQVSPARWAELERALTALDACARAIAESAP